MRSLLILFFISVSFYAQCQVLIGGKAGLNFANQSYDFVNSDDEPSSVGKMGFHLGVISQIGLSENVALKTGLIFSKKGSKIDLETEFREDIAAGATVEGFSRTSLRYLEVPLHFAFKVEGGVRLYAGPHFALSTGGKQSNDFVIKKEGLQDQEFVSDSKIKPIFGKEKVGELKEGEQSIKAFDFGFDVGIGYLYAERFLFNAGYSIGLANTVPTFDRVNAADPGDWKTTNRVISLSVTYFLDERF